MRLFLKTFRLIGDEKNYEFDFKKGLNFISGPTSTGKTTIFELIDYAFGAKRHKAYIEVEKKCTDIELEIILEGVLYKIRRTLFDFKRPVLVEIFSEKNQVYETLGVFSVDNPNSEKSFSNFLLSKIGLSGAKISNQIFSFRDLFKFSYLKQTKIDTEDILSTSNWAVALKEKQTFEIIFNFYDSLLGDLKTQLKKSKDDLKDERLQYEGIENFLKSSKVENFGTVENRRKEINLEISELQKSLEQNTNQVAKGKEKSKVSELGKVVLNKKEELQKLSINLREQSQYISKLRLLFNQYEKDIEKTDAIIMGVKEINKYEFTVCPNCLKPITIDGKDNCCLCGGNLEEVTENVVLLRHEKRSIVKKKNELDKHILSELERKSVIQEKINIINHDISYNEQILGELTDKYVSPLVTEISLINLKLGELYKELNDLDNNLRFIRELNRLGLLLHDKENEVINLNKQIQERSNLNDRQTIINNVSTMFENILEDFKFPKLENAYISPDNYLPYVRGRKYSELGSLGAVTLITMAYYLSILLQTTDNTMYNHLNLLMIDTPRKNLGATSTTEEFRDEEIYNSIIKNFINIGNELSDKVQLIIINNGYPNFLPDEDLIVEFSSNGKIGLIDDIDI